MSQPCSRRWIKHVLNSRENHHGVIIFSGAFQYVSDAVFQFWLRIYLEPTLLIEISASERNPVMPRRFRFAVLEDVPEKGLSRGQVGPVVENFAPGVFQ